MRVFVPFWKNNLYFRWVSGTSIIQIRAGIPFALTGSTLSLSLSLPLLPRCQGMASWMWRRPWSCLDSSSTTKCSCSPSSERWKCSARSPWGTVATWPHLSWRPCRGDWSTPPTSLNTCCRTSSTATWRARTTQNCCCEGSNTRHGPHIRLHNSSRLHMAFEGLRRLAEKKCLSIRNWQSLILSCCSSYCGRPWTSSFSHSVFIKQYKVLTVILYLVYIYIYIYIL